MALRIRSFDRWRSARPLAAGVLLVRLRAALDRRAGAPARQRLRFGLAGLSRALPLASAAAITVVGLFLAVQGASGI
jgi:hypothetical protein